MAVTLNITRGADKVFFVRILHKDTQEPYDLTGAAEIKLLLPVDSALTTSTSLVKKLSDADGSVTIVSAPLGKIQFSLQEADTTILAVGEGLSFEVEIQIGPGEPLTSIVQFIESMTVIARLF